MTIPELESIHRSVASGDGAELVRALREAHSSPDVSKLDLISFLDRALDGFSPEARRICSSWSAAPQQDRDALALHARLLACGMIVLCGMRSVRQLRDRALQFLELASATVQTPYPLAELAVRAAGHDITSTGLTWTTVEKAASLDVLAFHFCGGVRFSRTEVPFSFAGRGLAALEDGSLVVSPSDRAEADAFTLFGGAVAVRTPKSRDVRLKQTDRDDAAALRSFFSAFTASQRQYVPPREEEPVPADGDWVDIRYTGEDGEDGSPVMCVVGHEDIRGGLIQEELVHYVWTDMVTPFLFPGDCILGARLDTGGGAPSFSIASSYETFARRRAEACLRSGRQFEARAVRVFARYARVGWLTAAGFGGVSALEDGVAEGTVRVMEVESVKGFRDTFINLRPPKKGVADGYDRLATGEGEGEDILEEFVTTRDEVLRLRRRDEGRKDDSAARSAVLRLARIIAGRAPGVGTLESLRILMTASFLALAAGDDTLFESLSSRVDYLSALAAWAQGEPVPAAPTAGEGERRILACLGCGRDAAGREALVRYLGDGDPVCRQVAGLLFAGAVSEEFRDEVSADADTVRRKVCSLLGVGDAFRGLGGAAPASTGRPRGTAWSSSRRTCSATTTAGPTSTTRAAGRCSRLCAPSSTRTGARCTWG